MRVSLSTPILAVVISWVTSCLQFSMMSLLVKEKVSFLTCTVDSGNDYILVMIKLYISEVVLGTAFGIIMGPNVANIFDPRSWATNNSGLTLEVMRVVLATGLFAIGV